MNPKAKQQEQLREVSSSLSCSGNSLLRHTYIITTKERASSLVQMKKVKFASSVSEGRSLDDHAVAGKKICGALTSTGGVCRRTPSCPFHSNRYVCVCGCWMQWQWQERKKNNTSVSVSELDASSHERIEQANFRVLINSVSPFWSGKRAKLHRKEKVHQQQHITNPWRPLREMPQMKRTALTAQDEAPIQKREEVSMEYN